MTQPILPKLKRSHNVKSFNEAGKWDIRDRDSLQKLSSGLKVDKVETEISSIPDMWARPMLFEMALLNRDHVLHERIVGEWRGLLGMIALKDVLGLKGFTAEKVALPQLLRSNYGDDHEPAESNPRDFLVTLAKLLPKASLATDTSWQSLYVFIFNNEPFGMTSPTTLVSTASDYLNRISSQEVRWFDGTYLTDPAIVLPSRQKEILSGWLYHLISAMGRHQGINTDRWNLISGLLRSFTQDLGDGNYRPGKSTFGIQGFDVGFFKYLDKPAEGNIHDGSHVRLIPSKDRSPAKPLLVFDRTIADQWNVSPQNVTLNGVLTLASAHVQVNDADVWKAEGFFTKKLFVIYQPDAFPGTIGEGNQSVILPGGTTTVTPILPLNRELMQHLSAADLAKRIQWDQTSDGLKLRLTLQLSGIDPGSDNTIELTKIYKREDIHVLDTVPIVEIWPNFTIAGWSAYYTCYSTDDVSNTFSAEPFVLDKPINSEVSLGGRRKRLYWRSNKYPEAMICRASVLNERTRQMETIDGGLLLLAEPNEIQPLGNTYKVGIDFGASSTTICARTGQRSFPIKFENRKTSITASGDQAQAQLFDFFVPRGESKMPVLSFFQDFKNNLDTQELRPFLDGHAYLLETAELFNPETRGLAFDLKWSKDEEDRKRVRAFLTQLCLQAAAELVVHGAASAGWSFSYPTAFSKEQIQGFPAIWTQVTKDCELQSGLKLISDNTQRTESEAAALYFVTHCNAATAVGTVFIDIGGSTSDISIWQDDKPTWQTSVLLAGRSIFSNYLWHHPEFLGSFGINVTELVDLKRPTQTDRRPYHAFTDALLRYHSEQIFQHLPLNAGTEPVTALRQHLALGVGGLFFYVGSLLRYLIDEKLYREEIPNVYIGGNGSQIFRWLDIDRNGQMNVLYKALLSGGANWKNGSFDVRLSPEPKMEAAYGLVSDRSLLAGNSAHKVLAGDVVVREQESTERAGEPQNERARTLGWDTILTAEMFSQTLRPAKQLVRFPQFLQTFNRSVKETGLFAVTGSIDDQLHELHRRLGQSLNRYRGTPDTTKIVVEPVFIIALRQWLDIRLGG
jgi:hypothetical protein